MASSPETPSEASQKPRKRSRLKTFALRLLVVTVVYVLSIGPMFWSWYEAAFLDGSPLIVAFYTPLRLACAFEPFEKFINWYIDVWNF